MTEKLLTTEQAAAYLAVSKAFLERDRWAGARIPFVRIGLRAVRYRQQELDAFIEKRMTASSPHEEICHD